MSDVMTAVIDELLKSVQSRVAAVEAEMADRRDEMMQLRERLETARRDIGELRRAQAGMVSRLDRIERRIDATDVPIDDP